MNSTRGVTYIGAGILALVVIGAVVVLLAEGREPTSFPPGSPQAAMQDYLAAWEDGDMEAAYGFFSDEIKAGTSLEEYQRAVRGFGESYPGDEAVYIDAADGDADRTTLHLTIEHSYGGGGLGQDVYRSTTTVPMVHQADGWKIDQQLIGVEPVPFPADEPKL